MTQAQRVAGLVQCDAEHIDIRADLPTLIVVEMHIPGNWLHIHRHRIEGVRQDAARAIKRIPVSVRSTCKQHRQGLGPDGIGGLRKGDLHGLGPFCIGALDLRLS